MVAYVAVLKCGTQSAHLGCQSRKREDPSSKLSDKPSTKADHPYQGWPVGADVHAVKTPPRCCFLTSDGSGRESSVCPREVLIVSTQVAKQQDLERCECHYVNAEVLQATQPKSVAFMFDVAVGKPYSVCVASQGTKSTKDYSVLLQLICVTK